MSSAPLRKRWILAGAVVVAAGAALLISSCSTAPLPPSLGPSTPALAATLDRSVAADQDAVDRFIALFTVFEADALSTAALQVYATDAVFNDGFVVLEGADAIAEYLARSAGHVSSFELDMQDVVLAEREVYLRWEMAYTVSGEQRIVAPGITHLRFGGDGKVIYHRDYWDASGALVIFVPPAAKILAAIRDRV